MKIVKPIGLSPAPCIVGPFSLIPLSNCVCEMWEERKCENNTTTKSVNPKDTALVAAMGSRFQVIRLCHDEDGPFFFHLAFNNLLVFHKGMIHAAQTNMDTWSLIN